MNTKRYLIYVIAVFLLIGTYGMAKAACQTEISFTFDPGTTVSEGTPVTMTEEITTTGPGGCTAGAHVDSGAAKIQAVQWNGQNMLCDDIGKKKCSQGNVGVECNNDHDCKEDLCENGVCKNNGSTECKNDNDCEGTCTEVELVDVATEEPTDGILDYMLNTTGLGGQTLGFQASYSGVPGSYQKSDSICTDLTVNEEEDCTGATISIVRADGPGAPAPGGPYDWSFTVIVKACEDLIGVTAQGGTNGWAPLKDRSEDSLDPDTGDAVIRKSNKKNETILWTIGDMTAGQTAMLTVDLSGSIPDRTPDCQVRYLSGPWSALFSTDGTIFEKTDYTGRVYIQVDSNGDPADCEP